MKRLPTLPDRLTVASPCSARWDDMHGDDRVRFCDTCRRPVYNLSDLTGVEIADLVRRTEEPRCVRFYRRADGTTLTRDCPVGHRNARRRFIGFVAGAALLGGFGAWFETSAPPMVVMGEVQLPE